MKGIITLRSSRKLDASKSRNGSFIPSGTQTTEGTETTDPPKGEKVNFPFIQETTMNTLNLIRKQIEKQSALHDAQINHTAYRGIVTKKFASAPKEVHGKFTYRGHTYTK